MAVENIPDEYRDAPASFIAEDKVIGLRGAVSARVRPNSKVIALLEETLAEARRGEIDGVAIAIGRPNGGVATKYEFGTASFRLFGSLALLSRDMQSAVDRKIGDTADPDDGNAG